MVAEAQMRGHVLHVHDAAVDPVHFLLQRVRLGRRDQPAVAPFEKRYPQLDLQMPDEAAYTRLRNVEQLGSVGGGAGRHHGAEHLDLSEVQLKRP